LKKNYLTTIFISLILIFITFTLICYPHVALQGSKRGLNIWWEIVFPSLLPFFILSDLLICFGIVNFIGVLLEPLMKPLFKVPGVGGFVWAMGMASGFPAGAKISTNLYKDGELTKVEAERLISFTNSSNPLFIFAAVSVGFFNNRHLGLLFALSHYISNAIVGLIMRFYHSNETMRYKHTRGQHKENRLLRAFRVLHIKRTNEKRPVGKILGDAIVTSIQTLLMIGGFIITFSVLNKLLFEIGFITFFSHFIEGIFSFFSFHKDLAPPFVSGLFEITLGSQLISEVTQSSLLQQVMITSVLLGFGGFSIHAQVASIISEAGLRFKPYFFGRIIQAILSPILIVIFWRLLNFNELSSKHIHSTIPAFNFLEDTIPHMLSNSLSNYGPIFTLTSLYVYIILLLIKILKKKKEPQA